MRKLAFLCIVFISRELLSCFAAPNLFSKKQIRVGLKRIPRGEKFSAYLVIGKAHATTVPSKDLNKSHEDGKGVCAFDLSDDFDQDRFPAHIMVATLKNAQEVTKCYQIKRDYIVLKRKSGESDPALLYTKETQTKIIAFMETPS